MPRREHRQDLIAVYDVARGIDSQTPVGITVVGDARIGAMADDETLQLVEVGRPAAVVDVEPIWVGECRDDVGAQPSQRLRGGPMRGTVRAVDDHAQPVEPMRCCVDDVRHVLLESLG